MPQLINRVPPGLLSLLGIKSLGQNPSLLADQVAPILELGNFYLGASSQIVGTTTGTVNATGIWAVAAIQPNPGELIICSSLFCSTAANLAAATTIRFVPVVFNVQSGLPISSPSARLASGTAGERPSSGWEQAVVIAPGQCAGIWVDSITLGTAPDIRVDARVTRLAI